MYVCVYVRTYVYICMYVCMYVCLYVCMHTDTRRIFSPKPFLGTPACMHVNVCMHTSAHTHGTHDLLASQMRTRHTKSLSNVCLVFEQLRSEFADVLHSDHRQRLVSHVESDRFGTLAVALGSHPEIDVVLVIGAGQKLRDGDADFLEIFHTHTLGVVVRHTACDGACEYSKFMFIFRCV
jgi:hypothetical protein